jgi:hypothetical protein
MVSFLFFCLHHHTNFNLNCCSMSGDLHSLWSQPLHAIDMGVQPQHQELQESESELDRYLSTSHNCHCYCLSGLITYLWYSQLALLASPSSLFQRRNLTLLLIQLVLPHLVHHGRLLSEWIMLQSKLLSNLLCPAHAIVLMQLSRVFLIFN